MSEFKISTDSTTEGDIIRLQPLIEADLAIHVQHDDDVAVSDVLCLDLDCEDDEDREEDGADEDVDNEPRPPPMKRPHIDTHNLVPQPSQSIKQILFNINKAICLRLDGIEHKIEASLMQTKILDEKIQQIMIAMNQNGVSPLDVKPGSLPLRGGTCISNKRNNAVIIGLPQDRDLSAGQMYNSDGSLQGLGPNVTLITLNCKEDYPDGVWLGDESNLEMRVRVPITASDMLHITSNCRTAEKMGLTLLDYLFDRNTQANSNLSGMGKHGKMQLDPLMVYGIRCHLIYRFGITESDWHRIKQNVDSKCRTAWRRKQRGLPLTVKAFRGKQPLRVAQQSMHFVTAGGGVLGGVLGGVVGDVVGGVTQEEEVSSQLHIQVEGAGQALTAASAVDLIQSGGGEIQVIHATPEQVAQLQQTHQIQILQGEQVLHLHPSELQDGLRLAMTSDLTHINPHIQVLSGAGGIIQVSPQVEEEVVSIHQGVDDGGVGEDGQTGDAHD